MELVDKQSSIYVAGHRGLVGSAVVRRLQSAGYTNIVTRTSKELDLRDQAATLAFFVREQPEYVVMAAARVGGILANASYPADFISDNLQIQDNVIRTAHRHGVTRMVFLGSSCIYPKHAPQPMKEEHLLTGSLEPTNQWYAIAKIAGTKMCEAYRKQYGDDFITLMPTNLYGPGDNFDLEKSHVLAALIRKVHEARGEGPSGEAKHREGWGEARHREDWGEAKGAAAELRDAPVTLWGTGTPRREFLYSDDLADAIVFVLEHPEEPLHAAAVNGMLNVGVGEDLTIAELADLIRDVVGSRSDIVYDPSKPDGTPRKLLDVSRLSSLGWRAETPLREGIRKAYEWYVEHELAESA